MKKILLFSLLILSGISVDISAASFDCSKASTVVERTICDNKDLSSLDLKLSQSYKTAIGKSSQEELIRTAQRQWLAERNKCGSDVTCLKNTYIARINVLDGSVNKTPIPTNTQISQPKSTELNPQVIQPTKQQISSDTSRFFNLDCLEARPQRPSGFAIRHLSDKNATIIAYTSGSLDEAHVMNNQEIRTTDSRFSYSSSAYQDYRSRYSVKYEITSFYVDRMRGEFYVGTKSRNPTYNPSRGGSEFYSFTDAYPCKKISDEKFDQLVKFISEAKERASNQQKAAEEKQKEQIKNNRKF